MDNKKDYNNNNISDINFNLNNYCFKYFVSQKFNAQTVVFFYCIKNTVANIIDVELKIIHTSHSYIC